MTPADVEDLFADLTPVTFRRMFSGYGVYRDGLIFALVLGGELFLKTDEATVSHFEEAGSSPFVYDNGKTLVTVSYWRLPAEAFDDPDELARFAHLAFDAAARAGPPRRRNRKAGRRRASEKE